MSTLEQRRRWGATSRANAQRRTAEAVRRWAEVDAAPPPRVVPFDGGHWTRQFVAINSAGRALVGDYTIDASHLELGAGVFRLWVAYVDGRPQAIQLDAP